MGSFDGNPVLLLHHVGRRSGEERVTPLLYLRDGDDLVIVGSMGGTPKHPAWFHNLTAQPATEVEVGRERRAVQARVAEPAERARLWPRLVEHYPAFDAYQRAHRARDPGRDPLAAGVRFSPAGGAAGRMAGSRGRF